MGKTVIALVGRQGSGKSTAAEYLTTLGFARISSGDICREEAALRGIVNPTRADLQDVGDHLRAEFGVTAISERCWDKIQKLDITKAALEGARHPGDMSFVKEKAEKFLCLALIASQKVRFSRIVGRGSRQDETEWEKFLEADQRDASDKNNPDGQQTEAVIALADYKIDANKKKEEVFVQINQILKKEGII